MRSSHKAKAVNALEDAFLARVAMVEQQSLYGKQEAKKKKMERVLNLLDQCKAHGGPVTKSSIQILDKC